MSENGIPDPDLLRLVRDLRRARRSLTDAMQALAPDELDKPAGEEGWTLRRLVGYCGAHERHNFSRLYNFFDPEVKIYRDPASSLDHEKPADAGRTLARECAEVWLAGRETEMWLDLIETESLDSIRHASEGWPQGGWTIREVFTKVTSVYREKAKVLKAGSAEG